MKRIIKDTLILFAITLIAGILLGAVYEITKEPIARQSQIKKENAYRSVFEKYYLAAMGEAGTKEQKKEFQTAAEERAAALSFEEWSGEEVSAVEAQVQELAGSSDNINGIVTALNEDGTLLGYVITVTNHEGYGGDIQLSVGVLADGTVTGVEILSISETPGLGMNADKDSFKGQFTGVNADISQGGFSYTKTGKQDPTQIDAISSATFTTKSMTNGVNAALYAHWVINMSGEGGTN